MTLRPFECFALSDRLTNAFIGVTRMALTLYSTGQSERGEFGHSERRGANVGGVVLLVSASQIHEEECGSRAEGVATFRAVDEHAPWRITIALERRRSAARSGALGCIDARSLGLQMPRAEEDRSPALLIDVRAGSRADADAQAETDLRRARTRAGLPPAPPLVIGARTPLFTDAHPRSATPRGRGAA